MSRNNSIGRYSQSTKPKEICILLVNDDNICRDIVSHILDNCRFPYEDFSCEREMDALNIIREKKDAIEAIITNVHRTYANKYGIIESIEKEFKLQIILMLPDVDDMKKLSEDGGNGVTVYMMKSLSGEEFNTLWASAMEEKGKRESSSGRLSLKKKIGNHEDNGNVEKKPRIVWTNEMHQKFLEAVDHLGHDKAFPKKIVEVMNVPGLTRENVASHLQKYRLGMKQAQEVIKCSSYDFTGPFYTSLPNFQDSHWNPLRIRPRNTTASLFNLNCHESKLRTFPNMPLLNTIQIKPDRTFRICSNEKKNILLSIDDNKESSNTRFVGLRLTNDGKSVEFGQNGHFGVYESCVLGNDDSTLGSEKDDWMSSIVGFLGVDETFPDVLSHRKPPPVVTQPPPPAGVEWTEWAEPPGFTQLPPPENEVGGNFEIFNDFGYGTGIDEIGVGASGISVFDELLFGNQDLT